MSLKLINNFKSFDNVRSKFCLYFGTVGIKTSAFDREKTQSGDDAGRGSKSADFQHNRPKVKKEESSSQKIKRYNWETVNLFGPLLEKTKRARKVKSQNAPVDKAVEEAECSGVLATGEKNIKVSVWEAGYDQHGQPKIINPKKPLSPIKIKDTLIEFSHFQPKKENLKANLKSSSSIPQSNVKTDIKSNRNSIITSPLKCKDSANVLSNIPLCNSNGDEKIGALFASYCQNILGIANPSELYPASVTQILQKTMSEESRFVLERWENEMIAKLGFGGFQKYKQELFATGRLLHKHIENYYSEKIPEEQKLEDSIKGFWKSVQCVFEDITDVQLMESKVNHSLLGYKGVVDCIGKYKGCEAVIEWKTSQRPKISLKDLYDNPLQVAAYAGAINHKNSLTNQINRGVVVIAYSTGAPAHLHYLNEDLMAHFWKQWLLRLEKYFHLCYSIKS